MGTFDNYDEYTIENSFFDKLEDLTPEYMFSDLKNKFLPLLVNNDVSLEAIRDNWLFDILSVENINKKVFIEKSNEYINEIIIKNDMETISQRSERLKDEISIGVKTNYIALEKYQKVEENKKLNPKKIFFPDFEENSKSPFNSKISFVPVEIPAKLKIKKNGIIIAIDYDDEIRIPFDEIIETSKIALEIEIKLLNGHKIYLSKCERGNEVVCIINEKSKAIEDIGWL
ncbi:MAG: hypothetical protein LBM96_10050 [Methanobrevibacter sp.]|nr:hypothetical protein [Candidatus Methanoflexus mossambicus]